MSSTNYLFAVYVSVTFLLARFLYNKYLDKAKKTLKEYLIEGLLVFVSVIGSSQVYEYFHGQGKSTSPSVSLGRPGF
jgi:hypothetical protein